MFSSRMNRTLATVALLLKPALGLKVNSKPAPGLKVTLKQLHERVATFATRYTDAATQFAKVDEKAVRLKEQMDREYLAFSSEIPKDLQHLKGEHFEYEEHIRVAANSSMAFFTARRRYWDYLCSKEYTDAKKSIQEIMDGPPLPKGWYALGQGDETEYYYDPKYPSTDTDDLTENVQTTEEVLQNPKKRKTCTRPGPLYLKEFMKCLEKRPGNEWVHGKRPVSVGVLPETAKLLNRKIQSTWRALDKIVRGGDDELRDGWKKHSKDGFYYYGVADDAAAKSLKADATKEFTIIDDKKVVPQYEAIEKTGPRWTWDQPPVHQDSVFESVRKIKDFEKHMGPLGYILDQEKSPLFPRDFQPREIGGWMRMRWGKHAHQHLHYDFVFDVVAKSSYVKEYLKLLDDVKKAQETDPRYIKCKSCGTGPSKTCAEHASHFLETTIDLDDLTRDMISSKAKYMAQSEKVREGHSPYEHMMCSYKDHKSITQKYYDAEDAVYAFCPFVPSPTMEVAGQWAQKVVAARDAPASPQVQSPAPVSPQVVAPEVVAAQDTAAKVQELMNQLGALGYPVQPVAGQVPATQPFVPVTQLPGALPHPQVRRGRRRLSPILKRLLQETDRAGNTTD